MGNDEAMESELGLGELAGLTVANEADSLAYDVSNCRQEVGSLMNLLETWSGGRHQAQLLTYGRCRRIHLNFL